MDDIEHASLLEMVAEADKLYGEHRNTYHEILQGTRNIRSRQVIAILHLLVKKGIMDAYRRGERV